MADAVRGYVAAGCARNYEWPRRWRTRSAATGVAMRFSSSQSSLLLFAGLGLGVAADWLFVDRWIGVSAPLFVGAALLTLVSLSVREGRRPTLANLWLGGVPFVFAAAIAVRDEPLLIVLNILAVFGLLLLQIALYRREALAKLPVVQAIWRVLQAIGAMIAQPPAASWQVANGLRGERTHFRRLIPILRGLLLAAPVLGCFTLLLVAADSVFASYIDAIFRIDLPFDVDEIVRHLFVIGAMSWVCAGALLTALGSVPADKPSTNDELPAEGATRRLHVPLNLSFLGAVESLTILLLVDLLFGGFMLVQAAYFFGGLDTLARTGVTYADYARRGFFELLAVACLALALLWALTLFTRRTLAWQHYAFNGACAGMIVLVVGMLASAFQRMLLYEEAYGFTRLRIYTHSFMIWLAVVLMLFLIALLRDRPRLWSYGTFVAALIYLAALNIASPDALIVRANVARYATDGKLDAYYLTQLSADASPALLEALPSLDPAAQATISEGLQEHRTVIEKAYAEHGWPSWQWARWRASTGSSASLGHSSR